ncbi:MAG: DUF4411 family protein [Hyphomicrobiaceae bacterium]|nr:DUF4411 family protein [Hyphomicrobiaceae bacterium]
MDGSGLYCFDTSSLLAAWNELYPIGHFPTVWEHLAALVEAGRAIAPVEVRHEVEKRDDGLFKWLKTNKAMFVDVDEPVQVRQRDILTKFPRLVAERKNRFSADPWVIALALERGAAVVTDERATLKPLRPNIPDVCADGEFLRPCFPILEVIRQEKWIYR